MHAPSARGNGTGTDTGRAAAGRAALASTRARLIDALQTRQDTLKTDDKRHSDVLMRCFRDMDRGATGCLTAEQVREALGPNHLALGLSSARLHKLQHLLDRGDFDRAAVNAGHGAPPSQESERGARSPAARRIDYSKLCRVLRIDQDDTGTRTISCNGKGHLSKRYYDPFHAKNQPAKHANAGGGGGTNTHRGNGPAGVAVARRSDTSARDQEEGDRDEDGGDIDEWIVSQRGPLTSARGFLTGQRAAAASDSQFRAAVGSRGGAPPGTGGGTGAVVGGVGGGTGVDSSSSSAARRLARLEAKRVRRREIEARHAAARARETERRHAQAAARLEQISSMKGAVESVNNQREERAYERRVGHQRGPNERQHGACFGLSRGNGLAANVGGGATVGSSRCGSTGRATARTSRREQFFEKRNASTLDLNHF